MMTVPYLNTFNLQLEESIPECNLLLDESVGTIQRGENPWSPETCPSRMGTSTTIKPTYHLGSNTKRHCNLKVQQPIIFSGDSNHHQIQIHSFSVLEKLDPCHQVQTVVLCVGINDGGGKAAISTVNKIKNQLHRLRRLFFVFLLIQFLPF